MNDGLARAEAYRDALHDLPDSNREAQIMERAGTLAEQAFDKLDKESMRAEWCEANLHRFVPAAIDSLNLLVTDHD